MASQEIRSLPKIGILIKSRRAPNATAAASSPPTTQTGKGDMAMPKVASEARVEEAGSEAGKNRRGKTSTLAAEDNRDDSKRSETLDSKSQLELANCQQRSAEA